MQKQIEQVLDSREVAEMLGKRHDNLVRDIKGYLKELSLLKNEESNSQLKIEPSDFFQESIFTKRGKKYPCYKITKKGCEFTANKLTGIKGTEFTALFINRFHDMEEIISECEKKPQAEPKRPSLTAVTSAAKFLTELAGEAGCDRKIQLLAAKSFYNTNGYSYQLEIGADKQYWDTVHIARQVGICVKSSGKPADKAVNEIIRRIGITEEDYTDTWESKGNWQGTVRKYSDSVIDRVKCWIADNDYPEDIDYRQNNGEMKAWHVTYQSREVA
ncbi:rha family phage regulatory protein [Hungatella hathewayi 12489931]|uniref:Rha family transcriptional regulator n=1 Tax=Hungatella hathewayi TaxID=154046 RepID=UPI0002D1F467|nr:Rha family transcriptional regulator [Hungatella hathewayi]ENY93510.1 rha family phage regulatory protein [Hungatella hathewayi 12489931]